MKERTNKPSLSEALKELLELARVDVVEGRPEDFTEVIADLEDKLKNTGREIPGLENITEFIKVLLGSESESESDTSDELGESVEPEKSEKSEEPGESEDDLIYSLHVPTNISKKDGIIYIQMVVPGYEEDQVSVEISEDFDQPILTVIGTPVSRLEVDETIVRDFVLDGFTSTVEISEEIARGEFDITLQNGILSIQVKPIKKKSTTKVIF